MNGPLQSGDFMKFTEHAGLQSIQLSHRLKLKDRPADHAHPSLIDHKLNSTTPASLIQPLPRMEVLRTFMAFRKCDCGRFFLLYVRFNRALLHPCWSIRQGTSNVR